MKPASTWNEPASIQVNTVVDSDRLSASLPSSATNSTTPKMNDRLEAAVPIR